MKPTTIAFALIFGHLLACRVLPFVLVQLLLRFRKMSSVNAERLAVFKANRARVLTVSIVATLLVSLLLHPFVVEYPKLAASVLALLAGYFITFKGIPFVFVRAGRMLGFRLVMTPLTAKRVARFKSIRRGYFAFVVLSTLFVSSLFLEVLVNHKPVYLRYGDQTAYPALRDLGNNFLFFWRPFVDFDRSADFGIPGDGQLDYRAFTRTMAQPDSEIGVLIRQRDKELESTMADLDQLRREIEAVTAAGDEPEDWELEELASADQIRDKIALEISDLSQNQSVFEAGDVAIVWPIYEYSAYQTRLDLPGTAPFPPSLWQNKIKDGTEHGLGRLIAPLGTDPSGIDIIPQLVYGFRVSFGFAIVVLLCGYSFGILVGAAMGYFGGWVDIAIQRFIEVWASIPFLFTIMIIVEIMESSFWLLASLLVILTAWIGITYLIRGEFYREKAKDYVQAAIGTGVSEWKVIVRHILPNSLVPVISTAPFAFVAFITALVSLDYLGYGLPTGTPTWGAMLRSAYDFLKTDPHLLILPVVAFATTLFMTVLVGEAVREAFDPKVFSRLR